VIEIVVAHSANLVIGRDGCLPWHLPSDLRRFRELTAGQAVVMGRRTFESLPDAFRPLPDRRNIVLTSDPAYVASGSEVTNDLASALAACDGVCMVIGGGKVYEQALPVAARVHATHVEAELDGDTFFPALPPDDWRCVDLGEPIAENGHTFTFRTYERRA
jgi:dihydrofolate reductase